ncbi:hypothetical protein H4R21_001859 [Coemansia helicoidea]|uniref:Uncharacterized protein n=1 Tax=Coemansia helicoidea TaxID=1286919 RepID=A0ACC1L9U8_9FUNG|nr:hypothetical protein H4R21_001859 [Coemansia helicoidea]
MSPSDTDDGRDAKRRHIADDQDTHAARSTTGAGDSQQAEATVEMPGESEHQPAGAAVAGPSRQPTTEPAECATPPPREQAQAPLLPAGSPSKVHGGKLQPGVSTWEELARLKCLAVDKSAAILDVMDHEESVIIGLYPRRMGKSLFLGLLKDFLGVVSDTSYRDRRTRYEQYAIYQEGPKFFEDSIGRYAVFKLDLKVSTTYKRALPEQCAATLTIHE